MLRQWPWALMSVVILGCGKRAASQDTADGSTVASTSASSDCQAPKIKVPCDNIHEGDYWVLEPDDLTGLVGVCEVTGELHILAVAPGNNLDSLSDLQTVGTLYIGEIGYYPCPYYAPDRSIDSLTNIDGLSNLTVVDNLVIRGAKGLTNIDALSGLTRVCGRLDLFNNPALLNLDGLANLTAVGDLNIATNQALTRVGLYALETVLAVYQSDPDYIYGGLRVTGNTALTDLGMANLNSVDADLDISRNAVLCQTQVLELVAGVAVGGDVSVTDNDPGC